MINQNVKPENTEDSKSWVKFPGLSGISLVGNLGVRFPRLLSTTPNGYSFALSGNGLMKRFITQWFAVALLLPLVRILSGQTQSNELLPRPAVTEPTPITSGAISKDAPIGSEERLKWFAVSTVGVPSLIGGMFSAGFATAIDSPSEYGTHWDGFGKRYGMRMTGISTGNLMEAGIGAAWGEDPRYFRAAGQPFKSRIGHAVKMTFLAQNKHGSAMPAYARYVAITGNNFLSNTWRPDSEATVGRASLRVLIGFLGRMGSNVFAEFWPDVTQRLSRKKSSP